MRCPCLSGLPYAECCTPLHDGSPAPTAEALMRSRYSAFALGNRRYLIATWHPTTRPVAFELDSGIQWYRLDIIHCSGGSPLDATGIVEFEAYFRGAQTGSQRERSSFVKERGRWLYLEAV